MFATQSFSTDHLKHKTVNERLQQIFGNYGHSSWRVFMIIFWGFQGFLIYLAKHFDHF